MIVQFYRTLKSIQESLLDTLKEVEMANKVSDVSEKKAGKFSVRAIFLIVIVLLAVVGIVWFGFIGPNMTDVTACVAPEGFELITKTDAVEPVTGQPVTILRAIASTGIPIEGSKQIIVPACGSNDRDARNETNLHLQIDGKDRYIASGAIIFKNAPLALATQP